MISVSLKVNGKPATATVEPRTALGDYLRDGLRLTATHLACEHGVCGACTILLDGQPARACLVLTAACDGASIQTLEGLRDDPIIEVLRRAFTDCHGLQCGFCTPGMLVTALDLLRRKTDLDATSVRAALAGNLCRCTGYDGIVAAILQAAGELA